MGNNNTTRQNDLEIARMRMGYSRKQVAYLLGHRSSRRITQYERGTIIPTLRTALKLEILYRMPIAFLFEGEYVALREGLRAREAAIRKGAA